MPHPSPPSVCLVHASHQLGIQESAETSVYLQIQGDWKALTLNVTFLSVNSCTCILAAGPHVGNDSVPENEKLGGSCLRGPVSSCRCTGMDSGRLRACGLALTNESEQGGQQANKSWI